MRWPRRHVPVFVWKRRNWTTVYTHPVKTLTKIAKMRHFKRALRSRDFWKGRFNAVLVWMAENATFNIELNCLTITSRCWMPVCAHAPIKDGIRLQPFLPFLVDRLKGGFKNTTCGHGLKKKVGKKNLRFHDTWTEPKIMIDNDTVTWWGKRVTIGHTLYLVRSVETLY